MNNISYVETVKKLNSLDWEISPAVEYGDLCERDEMNKLIADFEKFNNVVLEGDALQWFRTESIDFYTV